MANLRKYGRKLTTVRINTSSKRTSDVINSLVRVYENYKLYKKARTGSSKVSSEEFESLREAVRDANRHGETLRESTNGFSNRLKEEVAEMSRKRIRESETSENKPLNSLKTVVENYKAHKMERIGENRVSYREVRALREAVAEANRRGIRLPEADENFNAGGAADAAAPAPAASGDPNAAAGAQVSPEVQALQGQVQSLLDGINSLAQSVGINQDAGADLGANPDANVPPVEGQDPNAALAEAVIATRAKYGSCDEGMFLKIKSRYGKSLVESIGLTRDRIAMRAAKLDSLNEAYKGDFAGAYFRALGLKEATTPIESIPSLKDIEKGTADAKGGLAKELHTPVAWPDHQITGAPIQGEGAKQQKVKESSVTDKYVEDFYAPKLSLDMIRESMKSGLLG